MKAQHGEYGAFLAGKRGVRFTKLNSNGKTTFTKEADVPKETREILKNTLLGVQEVVEQVETPTETPTVTSELLDAISIHSASLEDIAQALYDRFGIYTVYLGRYPQPDEVNPLTAEPMTNYERGQAYQAALRAEAKGLLIRNPTLLKKQLDSNLIASQNIQESFVQPAASIDESKARDDFEWRTSVERSLYTEHRDAIEHYTDELGEVRVRRTATQSVRPVENKDIEDEPYIEPDITLSANPIIRPDW